MEESVAYGQNEKEYVYKSGTPKLNAALAKAQKEFKPIIKSKTAEVIMKSGGKYSFNYADLQDIIEATQEALSKHGLSCIQRIHASPLQLIAELRHESGEVIMSSLPISVPQGRPQDFGSLLTFYRRYLVAPLLGVSSEEDDDAGLASGQETKVTNKKQFKEPVRPDPNWDNINKMNRDFDQPSVHEDLGNKRVSTPLKEPKVNFITEKQRARMYAIQSGRAAFGWTEENVKSFMADAYGIESSKQIPMGQVYDEIIRFIETTSFDEAYKAKLRQT